jgi:hypothetical protein
MEKAFISASDYGARFWNANQPTVFSSPRLSPAQPFTAGNLETKG